MTTAMILAAGRGTRLKHLTENMPKPLVPVAGVAPILRTLGLLEAAGYRKTVINTCYLAQMLEDVVSADIKARNSALELAFSREEVMLDTGGGVKNALPLLGDTPFLTVNSDLIWGEEQTPVLGAMPSLFDTHKMDALLLLMPREKAVTHHGMGDFFRADDGRLTLRGSAEHAPYVYTGIQMLAPRFFDGLEKQAFPLLEGYKKASDAGRLYGHVYTGPWVDMGTPDGMEAAAALLGRLGAAKVA